MLYDRELLACSQYAISTCVIKKTPRVSILNLSYTHFDVGQQQKHDKMRISCFSQRLIKTTSNQPQDNNRSIERHCFENNNR